jgi:hypothetical protein
LNEKKFSCQPQKCKLELYMSNGSEVLTYVFVFYTLPQRGFFLAAAATPNKHIVAM